MSLGVVVTGALYRYPGLLAKIVTTLDVLSGGRAQLGLGASWYEREQRGLGVPVVPVAERFARLEETLQICRQMWSGDDGPYRGRHYQLDETLCVPAPLSRPHPPIMVGGGEKRTLRLVARYAYLGNVFGTSVEDVAHKCAVLRAHCAAEGRDPATVQMTVMAVTPPLDDVDAFLADVEAYAALGVTEVQVLPVGPPVAFVERLAARVVGRMAAIG